MVCVRPLHPCNLHLVMGAAVILRGARIAMDARRTRRADLGVRGGRLFFDSSTGRPPDLDLSGCLVLPGLINAHDHLEFNLFPKLGSGVYPNAGAWAYDIYRPSENPVKQHLSVSKPARLLWGALKNLLSGVTTVAHHNPYERQFDISFPVRVVKRFGWAHSLKFSPDLVTRFRGTPEDWPFIVHAAEGTDSVARDEIQRLEALGILTDRTILVHAIGANDSDAQILAARGTSVVWCPSSNLSLYRSTLSKALRRSGIKVALGTDSAMTSHTNLIDEITCALQAGETSLEELYEMVTIQSAAILRLYDGEGSIAAGGVADLVVVRDRGQTPAEALISLHPELVLVGGEFRLVSTGFAPRLRGTSSVPQHGVALNDTAQWFTDIDLPQLHQETARVLGANYQLAGKQVSV